MSTQKTPTIKNGKTPLTTKKNRYLENTVMHDMLNLDPELWAELGRKNLVPKWLDANETYRNGGYDPEGWMVYKRDKHSDTIGLSDVKFGQDPTGVVRRGSLILSVMDKDQHAELKEAEQIKSARLTQDLNKKQAAKFRGAVQVDAEIHEGYEDNE